MLTDSSGIKTVDISFFSFIFPVAGFLHETRKNVEPSFVYDVSSYFSIASFAVAMRVCRAFSRDTPHTLP